MISRDSKLMGSRCARWSREVPNDREAPEGLHKLCADLVVNEPTRARALRFVYLFLPIILYNHRIRLDKHPTLVK